MIFLREENSVPSLFCHPIQAILAIALFAGYFILKSVGAEWIPIWSALLSEEAFCVMDILDQWLHFLH